MELEWLTDGRLRVGSTEFIDTYELGSTSACFHIRKPRELLEAYVEMLQSFRGAAVVELGIAQGGSVALMELVAAPSRLVALELDATPVAGLTDFIERRDIGDRIRPHFGVDQGDRERVLAIVTDELRGTPLDLVIDDASHLLEPSRASFDTLFPLLRPGGRYLIEDWNWQYRLSDSMAEIAVEGSPMSETLEAGLRDGLDQPDSAMLDQFRRAIAARLEHPDPKVRARIESELARQFEDPADRSRIELYAREAGTGTTPAPNPGDLSPLPALVIDLMLARATSGDVVAEVHIDGFFVWVTRGPAQLEPRAFRLASTFVDDLGLHYEL